MANFILGLVIIYIYKNKNKKNLKYQMEEKKITGG